MKLKLVITIAFLIFFCETYAQSLPENSSLNYLKMRYGNILKENTELNFYSATRFLPIISADKLSNWSSPNSVISINNIPFNSFPLNFKTLDLLPLDILLSDSISTKNLRNEINFIKSPINNSFRIRGFLGSETGDPLIYTFTRDGGSKGQNKNKIAPSGVISYSNKNSKLNYRITAGYFGNFSTGSGNDETMRDYNSYFYKKQNKQILGSAEFEYPFAQNKKLSFYSSIITYYGWDIPPFTETFTHFETFLHTIRLKAENIFKGFSFSLVKDGSVTEINKTEVFLPAKFRLSEFSFIPNWENKFSEKYQINIYSKINFETANDLGNEIGSSYQTFFNEEYKKWNFTIGIDNKYNFTTSFTGNFNLEFQKHFIKNSLSGKINFTKYFYDNSNVHLDLSSNVRFPNLTELFGNFSYNLNEEFSISGNEKINLERTNIVEAGFDKNFTDNNLSFSANIFFEEIQNPIRQKTFSSVRFNSFADIIRNAEYINEKNKKAFGGNFNFVFEPLHFLRLAASYNYIDNKEVQYTPKNKLFISTEITLPFNGFFSVEYEHKSKSFFEEYKVSKNDDHFLNTGFDGLTPETNIFGISYRQKLTNFYFAKELIFDISVRNIFDRINKYHPIGNNLGRAVIISVYTNI